MLILGGQRYRSCVLRTRTVSRRAAVTELSVEGRGDTSLASALCVRTCRSSRAPWWFLADQPGFAPSEPEWNCRVFRTFTPECASVTGVFKLLLLAAVLLSASHMLLLLHTLRLRQKQKSRLPRFIWAPHPPRAMALLLLMNSFLPLSPALASPRAVSLLLLFVKFSLLSWWFTLRNN